MGQLVGLKGTNGKEIDYFFIKRVTQIKKITKNLAGTNAGSNGALNIWIDDDNNYRCESMKFKSVLESKIFSDVKDVSKWLKEWNIKIK